MCKRVRGVRVCVREREQVTGYEKLIYADDSCVAGLATLAHFRIISKEETERGEIALRRISGWRENIFGISRIEDRLAQM